jgi:hypothetical protein
VTWNKRPKKIVRLGEIFEEHIYDKKDETWIGTWVKAGQEPFFHESARKVLDCNSCIEDRKCRSRNKTPTQALRSYKVEGCTEVDSFWWWEFGVCNNFNCWGPYKRTISFQRKGGRMRLAHFKELNGSKNASERIGQIYCNISESSGHVYTGVACTVGFGAFFWPLFKDLKVKESMNIYIQMAPKKVLPENVEGLQRKDWPPYYKNNPAYLYPHRIEFRIFPSKMHNGAPVSLKELENISWPELARVYGFMYPGGAGMRLEYYRFMDGPEPKKRIETPEMPIWWPGGGNFSGFKSGFQCGWAGPIISFWRRESLNNPFFS